MNKITVEIDGYTFYTTVTHYSPAVRGDYRERSSAYIEWSCSCIMGMDICEDFLGVSTTYDERITEKLLDIMIEREEARKLNAEDYKERMKNY
jgi:hypothetical protein